MDNRRLCCVHGQASVPATGRWKAKIVSSELHTGKLTGFPATWANLSKNDIHALNPVTWG